MMDSLLFDAIAAWATDERHSNSILLCYSLPRRIILPVAVPGQTAPSQKEVVELSTGWASADALYAEDCFAASPCAVPKVSGHPTSVRLQRPSTFDGWLNAAKVTPNQRNWIHKNYAKAFSKCHP